MKNNILLKEIPKMHDNVLYIGDATEKIIDKLNSNKNIKECNFLSKKEYGEAKEKGKTKKVDLGNLRKFKKKRINYLICDYQNIENYLRIFIKDSIYITKDYIYFCTNNPEKIKKLYSRYNVEIKEKDNILIIDVTKAKNNKIKEFFYNIIDIINMVIEEITNMLLS